MRHFFIVICSFLVLGSYAHSNELQPLERFDWKRVMEAAPSASVSNEINHYRLFVLFRASKKPYEDTPESQKFFENHLQKAQALTSDAAVMRFASDAVKLKEGFIVEMGVGSGRTMNFISALNPEKVVYGFDSFKGLPHVWQRADKDFPIGTFAYKNAEQGIQVATLTNGVVYPGMFKDVLPVFKQQVLKDTPVAFMHIDCDIYESTKDTFDALGDNIVAGTVIVFDELFNYPGYENHEWKAFQEFLQEKNLSAKFLAFNRFHEQVAVMITDKFKEEL